MTISARNQARLGTISEVKSLMQSLATLDAILESSWSARRHHFNSRWGVGMQLGSMLNGEGDSWFCVFSAMGAVLKGFAHESEMSPWHSGNNGIWPGVLEEVPEPLKIVLADPSLSIEETTFCFWRMQDDSQWHRGRIHYPPGDDPDGSVRLLRILDGNPNTYKQWAESYFERTVDLTMVRAIYSRQPLTTEIIRVVNPQRDLRSLQDDVAEIGYSIDIENA
jgi:hypothetical protein